MWPCAYCTLLNAPHQKKCSVCRKKKANLCSADAVADAVADADEDAAQTSPSADTFAWLDAVVDGCRLAEEKQDKVDKEARTSVTGKGFLATPTTPIRDDFMVVDERKRTRYRRILVLVEDSSSPTLVCVPPFVPHHAHCPLPVS